MSTSSFEDLVGLGLTSHETFQDYEQLTFEDGAAILSIYNSCEVRGFGPESEQAITSLMGQRLLAVTMCSSCVELRFDGGCLLSVDVRDEAFIGPEAMVLHQPGKSPVVWT